jgi:uncharacterized membrane protein YdjX (TVP38/TMEM64 family)
MVQNLVSFIQEGSFSAVIVSFVCMIILAFIPIAPIPVITAAIGMAFGFWPALFISWGGATVGAFLMFLLCRFLFQKQVRSLAERHIRLKRVLNFFEKDVFLAILTVRLFPIFPSFLINLAASVSTIKSGLFFLATLIGKLPTMIIFALAGNHAVNDTWSTIVLTSIYCVIIISITFIIKKRVRLNHK